MMKITNKKTSVLAALVLLIGLAAVVPAAAQMSDGRNDPLSKWKKTVIEHRVDKDKQFQISPTSPMAAASRLLIKTDPGQTKFLMLRSDSLKISADPGDGVQLSFKEEKDGKWTWESHAEGVTCSANGKPLSSGSVLTPGATMRSGVWAVSAYPSDKGLTLIVFDLQRPELKGFNGLLYFPPDRRFEVNATFEKFPTPKKVIMGTSRNLKKNFYRYARIRFKLDGK
ncbi:MAG: DUF1684 domain-containing protein, partial [bacterium]|nr:DUF1684 domain-containing protein [bacterium]